MTNELTTLLTDWLHIYLPNWLANEPKNQPTN